MEVYVQIFTFIPEAFTTALPICQGPLSNLHSKCATTTKSVPLKLKFMSLDGVASPKLILPIHPTNTFSRFVSGGVVSLTIIRNSLEPVFPALSVALHSTLVLPRANVEPDGGLQVVGKVPSTISV